MSIDPKFIELTADAFVWSYFFTKKVEENSSKKKLITINCTWYCFFPTPDSISARYPRKTQKHQLFHIKIRKEIVVPDQGDIWWREC